MPTISPPPLTLRDGLLQATLSWQTLLIFTLALVGAALVASAGPLVMGALVAATRAAIDLARPRFWRRLAADRERSLRTLPSPGELLDASLRSQVSSLRQARHDARQALTGASLSLQRHLCPSLRAQLEALDGDAALLVREGELLAAVLRAAPSTRGLDQEIADLTAQLDYCHDETLRREISLTADTRRRELAALRRLESERDLVAATLGRVAATMRLLPLQVAELDLLDSRADKSPRQCLQATLSSLHRDLAATCDSLRCVLDDQNDDVALLDA